jgi:hypothetical protein
MLIVTSDEVWGPRYMHVAIAPLLLCIGAAWPRIHWKIGSAHRRVVAAAGLLISFLGAFSYYGEFHSAMQAAGQNTMEWINGDTVWIEPIFEGEIGPRLAEARNRHHSLDGDTRVGVGTSPRRAGHLEDN